MNLAQTLDIAARLMAQAPSLIHATEPIADQALHAYWVYSRDLSNQWMQSLAICQKVLELGHTARSRQCWLEYEPDIREILRADVLQRVWYCILQAADRERGCCSAEPIARSALAAQMQTRIRALKLVLAGHEFDSARMKSLNHLRRNAESWSDFLCAPLAFRYEFTDILFNPGRAEVWENNTLAYLLTELQIPGMNPALSQLNRDLLDSAPEDFPLPPLSRLTKTMLKCFPPSAFDDNGKFRQFSDC